MNVWGMVHSAKSANSTEYDTQDNCLNGSITLDTVAMPHALSDYVSATT